MYHNALQKENNLATPSVVTVSFMVVCVYIVFTIAPDRPTKISPDKVSSPSPHVTDILDKITLVSDKHQVFLVS